MSFGEGFTDDDFEYAIAAAVKATDFEAVESLLRAYAVRNPRRAALVVSTMRLAVNLGKDCPDGPQDWCGGPRSVAPAEALTVLLPDVDWEALRVHVLGGCVLTGNCTEITPLITRLLAVYDGKDT